jgi:hypothetical protein
LVTRDVKAAASVSVPGQPSGDRRLGQDDVMSGASPLEFTVGFW